MSDSIIQVNKELVQQELKQLVRGSIEEVINTLLDKEADELIHAGKLERNEARQGQRSGHYTRIHDYFRRCDSDSSKTEMDTVRNRNN